MVTTTEVSNVSKVFTLEDYMLNPPDNTEWVDGELVEKNGSTAKHGRTQSRLSYYWGNYMNSNNLGGEVYISADCRTVGRGRCPDVAYLTTELLTQYGNNFTVLPQSFPLIAEIISPTDKAEEVFTKVREYLESGCQEIWLIFPDSQWVLVITQQQQKLFNLGDVVSTQIMLPGFSVTVDELLA
ncbi:Uma2 family endonuclease [Argonema galeatum]|uniref:Uma2 family endonuclease n=1 Tax=Argonema galeatum TaxID=2942762 RepID=UPI0020139B32|nr:Uma2 family endonuclease [Argonema galeatum]MCL1465542.1 Uma2 family endonuclease [Argonema galeatum A003/A1]